MKSGSVTQENVNGGGGGSGGKKPGSACDPLYSLYILQSARVWFQGGGVLHHLVHGDDQEDEIELSKQSNGSVNTWRYMSQDTADREAGRTGRRGKKKKKLLICL